MRNDWCACLLRGLFGALRAVATEGAKWIDDLRFLNDSVAARETGTHELPIDTRANRVSSPFRRYRK